MNDVVKPGRAVVFFASPPTAFLLKANSPMGQAMKGYHKIEC
jgi:hypothetical protein